MRLAHIKALVTGAAGGIGSLVTRDLVRLGAGVLLTDTRQDALDELSGALQTRSFRVDSLVADITSREGRTALAVQAKRSGVNTLINLAGVNPFGLLGEQSADQAEIAVAINVTAPMLLTQSLLPFFSTLPAAHVVNVGSMLGSIAMPGYCIYGATKGAVKTFSEALRRELSDTNIRVHHVSPRATRTPLNNSKVCELNRQLGIRMDDPSIVSEAIMQAIANDRAETYIGFPERIYRLLNAIFPGVIDRAIRRQLPVIRQYASQRPKMTAAGHEQAKVANP